MDLSLPAYITQSGAHPHPELPALFEATTADVTFTPDSSTSSTSVFSNASLTLHQKVADSAIITMDGSIDTGCMLVVALSDSNFLSIPCGNISMHAISSDEDSSRHVFIQLCDMSDSDFSEGYEIKFNTTNVDELFENLTKAVEMTPVAEGEDGGMDENMMNLMAAVQGGARGFIGGGEIESKGQFDDAAE
jgi:hypothetical protein